MSSAPTRQDRELRSTPQQHQGEPAGSSRHATAPPATVGDPENADEATVKDWEVLAMHLVECWLRAEKDHRLRQITHQHMTEVDAAQATGVISAFPPGQEARLREAVVAQGHTNYEAMATNLPLWVAKFRKGPPRRRYQLPTFPPPAATPPLQHLQRQFRRSWDGAQPPPVLTDLLDDSPAGQSANSVPTTRQSSGPSARPVANLVTPIERRLTELETRTSENQVGIMAQFRDTAKQLEGIHRALTQFSVNPQAPAPSRAPDCQAGPASQATPVPIPSHGPAEQFPLQAPQERYPPVTSSPQGHSLPFQYPAYTMGAPYTAMPHTTTAPSHWGGHIVPPSLPQTAPAPTMVHQPGQYSSDRPRRLKPDDVMVFDPQDVDVNLFTQRLRFVANHEGVYPVLSVLPFCLKGRAREWHTTLGPHAQAAMSTSFDSALLMLEREFRKDPIQAREDANRLRFSFSSSTSLPEYLTKKVSLLRAAGAYDLEGLKYDLWYGLEDGLASLAPIIPYEPLEDFCTRIRSLESGARRTWMATHHQETRRRDFPATDAGPYDRTFRPRRAVPAMDPAPRTEQQRQPLTPTQRQPRQLSRPCRHCGGQHYDNQCTARKVQFAEQADIIDEQDMADLAEFDATEPNLAHQVIADDLQEHSSEN